MSFRLDSHFTCLVFVDLRYSLKVERWFCHGTMNRRKPKSHFKSQLKLSGEGTEDTTVALIVDCRPSVPTHYLTDLDFSGQPHSCMLLDKMASRDKHCSTGAEKYVALFLSKNTPLSTNLPGYQCGKFPIC
ncbi:hypothetical protein PHET_07276 [Paragonimus heterotremus]|uniref:Uncharacterized protein n=1 Tax=Paragonimus heterotremus TaxID=100268 RepID=A0A8J4TDF5_9TREM|nr:hypothetical protein PHET_07276 [Paragonimus heterotremus]